jgi:glutamate synthase (NADPH/NADH) small chain
MQQRVTHAEVEEVSWEKVDGSYVMKPVPGSRKQIEAELILLAMGFVHPVHEGLVQELGIELDHRNNIGVNRSQMSTNVEKVFATGDAVNGASLVVTAIASGRRTARKIDDYLLHKG